MHYTLYFAHEINVVSKTGMVAKTVFINSPREL